MASDGGPAFPVELRGYYAAGMTLRDWFAGQALVGLLASDTEKWPWPAIGAAMRAYDIADAMLNARQELQP